MGNNHSSPICNRLCPGSTRPLQEDPDEWFDTGKKKKKSKPSRKTGFPKTLPVLPEDDESPVEEGGFADDKCSETTTLINESSSGSNRSKSSDPSPLPSLGEDDSEEAVSKGRRHSDGMNLKKVKSKSSPSTKLSFVNGQFIDLKTAEGKEMAAAAKAIEAAEGAPTDGIRRHEISGVDASIHAGHGGILPATSGHRKMGKGNEKSGSSDPPPRRIGRKTIMPSKLPSMGKRSDSNASQSSDATSKTASSTGSNSSGVDSEGKSQNAVTSIISLGQPGDGYFLTASKFDRVIKMWKAADKSLNVDGSNAVPDIKFVRDFVGHTTGVTTLTRVDDKGRFLSASKDGLVFLWDSRYDSGDDEEEDEEEHRIILAKFDKMDRRAVKTICMIKQGSYVRPDDEIDFAMLRAAARKTLMGGSAGLQQAAREKHIIGCSCEFATITGHHNVVKLWSVNHIEDQAGIKPGGNCAEVKLDHEIKNDIVIKSLTAVLDEGMILTGDCMGNIKLWRGGKNMLGADKGWTCERTFNKNKKKLQTVDAVMDSSITALRFISDEIFVSGSRGGGLRVWNVDSEKDLIGINGAHSEEIVDIKLGSFEQKKKGSIAHAVFSSASEDGKVLSWNVTLAKNEKAKPLCFDVVNHSIDSRYLSNREARTVSGLECIDIPNTSSCDVRKAMFSTTSSGDIHLLSVNLLPDVESQDALLLHREQIEEEAITLHSIAPDLMNSVEIKDRKKHMLKYKLCFVGSDAITCLIDKGHAVSRKDALDLGRILESRFKLFELYSHSGREKSLDDDDEFYRFTDECVEKMADRRNVLKQNLSKSARM